MVRFHLPRFIVVETRRTLECSAVEHVRGIVHILYEAVGFGPFHKDPAFQFFQQSVFVFELFEICQQIGNPCFQVSDQLPVAAAFGIIINLNDKPE
ncbi:hypothetical protein SDC9_109543 [bioreactor metagenome]|uniref:Uncharacterized protein n=1 Tax=bioreactor metagenome TaxID=1076179 RepID=A0A645BC46_9ZZZZ